MGDLWGDDYIHLYALVRAPGLTMFNEEFESDFIFIVLEKIDHVILGPHCSWSDAWHGGPLSL